MSEKMDCNDFDLGSYAQRYTGLTKVGRLCFIADTNPACAGRAINMAVMELRNGINTHAYISVFEKYSAIVSQNDIRMDMEWITETGAKAQQTLDKLQSELSAVKTAGVKDSIRMSYCDIGHFHLRRGDFDEATKAFTKARDFCTQGRHMSELVMSCIRVCMDGGNVRGALGFANKIDSMAQAGETDIAARTMRAQVIGLNCLYDASYKHAAEAFLSVEGAKEVFPLTSEDVATYGTLCAMAALSRGEVNAGVLQSTRFKKFFENAPEIRQLVQCFIENRFGECIAQLGRLETQLVSDIHLSAHVGRLRKAIVANIILNYCLPYGTASLASMAETLGLSLAEIEAHCARLISSKALNARLDSLQKLLYKVPAPPPGTSSSDSSSSARKVFAVAEAHSSEMARGILKCSVFQHGLVVKPTELERQQLRLSRETELFTGTLTGAAGGAGVVVDDNYYSPSEDI
jgi:COP9 signalosome complex subunit 1